jgi:hypothetical protein
MIHLEVEKRSRGITDEAVPVKHFGSEDFG